MENHGIVSVDGLVTKAEDAKIPLSDRGFLFGDGVFETIVAFGTQMLDVTAHLDRLRESAEDVRMEIPWSNESLAFEMQALVDELKLPKTSLRLMVTRGSSWGFKIPQKPILRKIIWCRPAETVSAQVMKQGLKLKRRNQPFTIRGAAAKVPNYLRSTVAVHEAEAAGYDEVLWANSENEFTEAATANVFFIARQGDTYEVVTPAVQSGILEGITRQKLLDICRKAGADVKEMIVYTDELPRFDEAFLCSTVRGLVPVSQIDQHKLHTTHERSLFNALYAAYVRLTAESVGKPLTAF